MCSTHDSGAVELYFYEELPAAERAEFERHLRSCATCGNALGELRDIRAALAAGEWVGAPDGGDWAAFMDRLSAATIAQRTTDGVPVAHTPGPSGVPLVLRALATAALLVLVAAGVFIASWPGDGPSTAASPTPAAALEGAPVEAALASVGVGHLERSKLVVLGLAAKDAQAERVDWSYERELAAALLADTRLYRLAAEERGLTSLAGVMKDLELVLLQTSLAETSDTTALPQIQRLIQKRGLVQKIEVVGNTGVLP